ncbi:ATP-binding protein [candidate division KSB1 bacterium]
MPLENNKNISFPPPRSKLFEDFSTFARKKLRLAYEATPRIEFLKEFSKILIDYSGINSTEIWLRDGSLFYRWTAQLKPKESYNFEIIPKNYEDKSVFENNPFIGKLCANLIDGKLDSSSHFFTKNGSFWTNDTQKSIRYKIRKDGKDKAQVIRLSPNYKSIAIIPFVVDDKNQGLLHFKHKDKNYFNLDQIKLFEIVAHSFGVAVAYRRSQKALRERIKELTCLFNIVKIAEQQEKKLDECLKSIVKFLPSALQYPEIAQARIVVDKCSYITPGFLESKNTLNADIEINGIKRGIVEFVYTEEISDVEKGLFLQEEQSLIDVIARELSFIIERKKTEEEKSNLQEQLRHADRLATIGQLAAGISHELNEPLGGILGLAQLLMKIPELPNQAKQDVQKIISVSLYTREVVKKLLIFAKQMPPHKVRISMNQVVKNGITFFESQCAKEGIELVSSFSSKMPEIIADPAQLTQVLINLAINAIQAMPEGGKLKVKTSSTENYVSLIVEDNGIGMSKEVLKQIFLPFFTTKGVNQGTGIGLAVVHGIVSSHGGRIIAQSKVNIGSQFEIQLPRKRKPSLNRNT